MVYQELANPSGRSEAPQLGPMSASSSGASRLYVRVPVAAAIGFLGGVGATFLGFTAFFMIMDERTLVVDTGSPASVEVGEAFQVSVTISNPHGQFIQFSDLDFPDEFFKDFAVQSLLPQASADSPLGGYGTQTYYYETDIPPDAQKMIVLTLQAAAPGCKAIQFDVCTGDQNCSRVVRGIEVRTSH